MARRKADEPAPGSPAWMATFSDLMNLLLCFFVLLFSGYDCVVAAGRLVFRAIDLLDIESLSRDLLIFGYL